jgi:hypothetical protein
MLFKLSKQIEGRTSYALDDAAAWPIPALMRHFRPSEKEVMFGGRVSLGMGVCEENSKWVEKGILSELRSGQYI